jgi:periplasmic protein TonB
MADALLAHCSRGNACNPAARSCVESLQGQYMIVSPSRVTSPPMQVKTPLLASLFGLLSVSAIPSYAQTVDAQTNTVEAWKKKIVIQLVSKREFPFGAMGQGGTAKVRFVIDRQGKLISREPLESAGSELLDAAALRMVERAEPFPEPRAEVRDDGLSFIVPVVFAARKQAPWAGGQWPEEWVEEQDKVNAKIHGICRGC